MIIFIGKVLRKLRISYEALQAEIPAAAARESREGEGVAPVSRDEILFYAGIALAAAGLLLLVGTRLYYWQKNKALQAQFDREYGQPWK